MAKTFVEAHVDIPAMEADLASIQPPTITQEKILERLTPAIRAACDGGATDEQIQDVLKPYGITVSKTTIAKIRAGKDAAAPKKSPGRKGGRTQPEPPAPAPPAGGDAQGTLV